MYRVFLYLGGNGVLSINYIGHGDIEEMDAKHASLNLPKMACSTAVSQEKRENDSSGLGSPSNIS